MSKTVSSTDIIAPGSVIGIIGGGQLGRMTALAAANLGYACHIFCPEAQSPAMLVSSASTIAAYSDAVAINAFAKAVDVVTFEFENIPHETVQLIEDHVPVRPGWRALHVSQNRLREKEFLNQNGAPTAPYRKVESAAGLDAALKEIGRPAVLKTAAMGYDGKGQVKIDESMSAAEAWAMMGSDLGILEGFVDFSAEISVVIARKADGTWAAFDPVENRHAHHILDLTLAPALLSESLSTKAVDLARKIAEALDYVGVLAVEMFLTKGDEILVNEIAPRPHNSGHWTMDACATSQFEQLVRAVCNLPLGSPARHHDAVMKNLIGEDVEKWREALACENAHLHLYAKREARAGRKMGHINYLFPKGTRPKDVPA